MSGEYNLFSSGFNFSSIFDSQNSVARTRSALQHSLTAHNSFRLDSQDSEHELDSNDYEISPITSGMTRHHISYSLLAEHSPEPPVSTEYSSLAKDSTIGSHTVNYGAATTKVQTHPLDLSASGPNRCQSETAASQPPLSTSALFNSPSNFTPEIMSPKIVPSSCGVLSSPDTLDLLYTRDHGDLFVSDGGMMRTTRAMTENMADAQRQELVADRVYQYRKLQQSMQTASGTNGCRFCKQNGERHSFYTTHTTKDVMGFVTCPVLRSYVCQICGATGGYAHTRQYCPLNVCERRQTATAKALRAGRNCCGRRK